MLTNQEINRWYEDNAIADVVRQTIETIRSSPPSRHVSARSGNVCGRYPSRKTGVTIQYESHRVELPLIMLLEREPNVLEYYDQPPSIKFIYEGKNGKRLGHLHTPDFFVIKSDSAGWIECKTEQELEKLSKKNPNRYYKDESGSWRCPPGERYAEQLGFFYHVCSDKDFNWTLQRNLIFLDDYFRNPSPSVKESARKSIISIVSEKTGITLAKLLDLAQEYTADDIYNLILTNEVYVDLETSLLVEQRRVKVFPNRQTAKAYELVNYESSVDSAIDAISPIVRIVSGSQVCWDGRGLKILHAGESEITLVDENDSPVVLKRQVFEGLVHQGKITNLQTQKTDSIQQEAWAKFQMASPEDQTEALCRYEIIKPYLEGNPPENETTPKRTIRDWKSKYLKAKHKYNCGLIGLLSRRHAKGNRTQRVSQETQDLIEKVISENYETIKQKNILSVYGSLLVLCEEQGIQEPSYFTFTKKVHNRSTYEQTKARKGRRAAYQHKKFYWELTRTTPRHGDRPFEICHIDHTEADIELVSSETDRNLGRPWLTLLTDAYSRRILAIYLTFDPPSYRSCLMVLRVCVKRHGRMPQTIVVDNGAEFGSTYFETLLAATECNKKQRPPAQARFGSVCERLFGTTNTQFFNNLKGNTQITRNVRQVTKSVNPKNHAVWTLAFLYDHLCHWAYEIYDTIDHPALDQTPQEAFAQGMLQSGERSHLMIPYNKEFCMLTLPTTSRGKAQIKPGKGVKINYIYYWSNLFRDPELENTSVPIKYDPFNIGIAYAFVKGQWVECVSQYNADFRQHSERELKLASTELRKRKQNYSKNNKVSAKKLANFITSVEGQEFLFEQRSKDLETQKVIQIIEGNLTPITQYRKDKHIEKVTELEPENSELESYAISESSWFEEDSDDDNEFDFSFDELKIYNDF